MNNYFLTIICIFLLITIQGAEATGWLKTIVVGVVGAGATALGIPAALGFLGFTGAGIVGGSYAAGMMSSAAVAGGGGVAAGSIVSVCQSIGAAGLSWATTAAMSLGGGVFAAGGKALQKLLR